MKALIVIDMQNGFCHPEGSLPKLGHALAGADAAVAGAAVAVSSAREQGMPVIFTRHVYRPGFSDEGPWLTGRSPDLAAVGGLLAGSWDGDVVDELNVAKDDLIVDKCRLDAFQWTSLEPLLRGLGVTELVACGVVTNFCVETTVRSAIMRDFEVTLLEDCCAAQTPRLHEIGVEVMRDCGFATVTRVAAFAGATVAA
ncbi:cysteine hydrolase family protein [Amycolatopsis pithecellobii]|uniref:Isochorismatase family protein n=1 Tax=Amycolatopsis pithecellobii TaxID=664692 RepID=A0A6N7Z9D9_9PSEU|nr:isochorismatase family cysteine hydrolase [Amycolatopsis pithecellobii]MTD58344.1 isochorismatase family protein [Amycolatopsis pithecellobii]